MIYIDTAFKLIIARYYTPSTSRAPYYIYISMSGRCIQAIDYKQSTKGADRSAPASLDDLLQLPGAYVCMYTYVHIYTHTQTYMYIHICR